jgi:O-antigen ligase/Tfp pilus assembly protein PilF
LEKATTAKRTAPHKVNTNQGKPVYYFLLFAYLLGPVFTPNFFTLDSNGPKFLGLAMLNLVAWVVFYIDAGSREHNGMRAGFFRNYIGLAYSLFVIISLLSIFQAYNLPEALINLAKIFTIFTSAFALYLIFSINRVYIVQIATVLAFLLVFDSLTVFYHILEYINNNVTSIYDIKSVYSHKNILSAALFVKIPVAVWLMLFNTGWLKKLGYLSFLLAAVAVLFLSARAFYLGLAMLLITLAVFFAVRNYADKSVRSFKKILLLAAFFVGALILFTIIQRYFYPTNLDSARKFNTGFIERLSTIRANESSINARLDNWKRSYLLIKDHPLVGVGTGNWKIEVLKYESPARDEFLTSYKNHNDFIEVTAETGLPGGLVYLSIFFLIFFYFIKAALVSGADEEKLKYLFLAAFGILAYSVDAFFNFPNDRPEIQALFAMYVAIAILYSGKAPEGGGGKQSRSFLTQGITRHTDSKYFLIVLFLFSGASALVLYMNAKSLYFQRHVIEDLKLDKYSRPASFFIQGFPSMPDISCDGAPISTYIARYLINENHPDEALRLLLKDNPNPYEGRREYFISMSFEKMGKADSVIEWGQRAYALKPLHWNMAGILSSRMFDAGKHDEAMQILNSYLSQVKTNPKAWLMAAEQNIKMGNQRQALILLDSALIYRPHNKKLRQVKQDIQQAESFKPYEAMFSEAGQAMNARRYPDALKLLNEIIINLPEYTKAYQKRALCLYHLGKLDAGLADVQTALKTGGGNEGFLLNLSGVIKIAQKRVVEACLDFDLAIKKGDKDAAANYLKFCAKNETSK